MMALRGIELTYETVREWCDKFGPYFAEELRRRNKAKLGSKWHLDEVFLKIRFHKDCAGERGRASKIIYGVPLTRTARRRRLRSAKRDRLAAERFFRKLLRRAGRQPGSLSRINFEAMVLQSGSFFPM